MRATTLTSLVALASVIALPVMAQTTTASTTTTSPATTAAPVAPLAPNPAVVNAPAMHASSTMGAPGSSSGTSSSYTTADDHMRASKIIGSSVYNDQKQKIGSVDELLVGDSTHVTGAVLSVGGFLGIDSKLVEVPFDQLKVDTTNNELVMQGVTKDQLKQMSSYRYAQK
jgi:sporulation protein YlmC with PRC-barrel domain